MWLHDEHEAKVGLEYKENSWDFNQDLGYLERYSDDYYFQFIGKAKGTVHNRIPSVFLQDSWV